SGTGCPRAACSGRVVALVHPPRGSVVAGTSIRPRIGSRVDRVGNVDGWRWCIAIALAWSPIPVAAATASDGNTYGEPAKLDRSHAATILRRSVTVLGCSVGNLRCAIGHLWRS